MVDGHGISRTCIYGSSTKPLWTLKTSFKIFGKKIVVYFCEGRTTIRVCTTELVVRLYRINNKIYEIHVSASDIFFTAAAYSTYKKHSDDKTSQ